MKIVLNKCYGGFSLSKEASELYNKLKGLKGKNRVDPAYGFIFGYDKFQVRTDPILIQVVEKLGEEKASGNLSRLKLINVPDNIENPHIDDYDGIETLEEGRQW